MIFCHLVDIGTPNSLYRLIQNTFTNIGTDSCSKTRETSQHTYSHKSVNAANMYEWNFLPLFWIEGSVPKIFICIF